MPLIKYIGPYDRFTVPRWGIGDSLASEPLEVSEEAAADLLTQVEVFAPVESEDE